MKKPRLVTPGPAMAPPEVLLELARPIIHHRTPQNKAILAEAHSNLRKVCVTENPIVIFASSGTGAMEAAVSNVVGPGRKAIVLSAGKFGERWDELCRVYGAETVHIQEEYGKAIPPQRVADALRKTPDAVAVFGTLSETSTAVGHDIESIGRIVAETPALLVVDGISGVGAMECRTDDWNIDLLVVGSQKALMLPPGLGFLAVSQKAHEYLDSKPPPAAYYFDLKRALASAEKDDTPFTPAHTLIAALVQSLRMITEDGIQSVWARTLEMSRAMLAAVRALGLESLAERPAAGLTAIVAPKGIDASAWATLLETEYGLKVAGGQGKLKGKIIRIAHMGYMDPLDIIGIVAALEWSLSKLGVPVEIGSAVAAASKVLGGAHTTEQQQTQNR